MAGIRRPASVKEESRLRSQGGYFIAALALENIGLAEFMASQNPQNINTRV